MNQAEKVISANHAWILRRSCTSVTGTKPALAGQRGVWYRAPPADDPMLCIAYVAGPAERPSPKGPQRSDVKLTVQAPPWLKARRVLRIGPRVDEMDGKPRAAAEEVAFRQRGDVVSFTARRLDATALYVILSDRAPRRF